MAKIAYIQNGATAKNGRRRRRTKRRNPTAKAAPRRNGITKASALSYAKKNGLKLVSKTVANGRRKRRRRNGIATTKRATGTFSRNGLLGNTKSDAKRVAGVIGGAAIVKIGSSIVGNLVAPYLAQVGLGKYAGILVDGVLALTVAPMVAKKVGGASAADSARLGGLLVVGVDAISMFVPSLLQYTPFNSSPVVLNGGQPLLTPAAVTQLVNSTGAPAAQKAAVAGAMNALASGRGIRRMGVRPQTTMLPVYS